MNKTPPRRKCVLIVDDEPKIGRILSLKLKFAGYETIVAVNGTEALEFMQSGKPDLMLLDIVMPGMNGLEVLERVRTFSTIPVVILTARPESIEKALMLGANAAMAKPFDPDGLLEKVRLILGNCK